jgi:hypothetical protein
MSEDAVNIPKLGPMNKKLIIGVGVAATAFVGYRYYVSRNDAAAADTTDTTDTGFEDPGALPAVTGAVADDNLYGDGTTASTTDTYGFTGTTNDQWTQYVGTQLSQSDTWSYTDVLSALGAFLAGKPLSDTQQQIVQAAIAVGGYPPVGTHTIVPGGNTDVTVAPTGLSSDSQTDTTVHLVWQPVAGADRYNVYRTDTGDTVVGVGSSTDATIAGLKGNTSYHFTVAAVGSNGVAGPRTGAYAVKTKAVSLKTPTKPTVSGVTATTATGHTTAVPGADHYLWYLNRIAHGSSDQPTYTLSGLSKNKTYSLTVAADTTAQSPTAQSSGTSFKTKSK